ncbi:MAG: acyl-CoA dehydrogenase family protein [Acidimicrobiales bacterium]
MIDLGTYRDEARKWLTEHQFPENDQYGDFGTQRSWQRDLFEAGWLGINWPTSFGGQGLSVAHHLAFAEELVRSGAPQPVGTIGLEVVGPTILEFGTDEQKHHFLPKVLSGEQIWCQGFSEPDAGSDLASLRTRARHDGTNFIVTGQKVWTSWASEADMCALLVRTAAGVDAARKHDGLSYLLVDMTLPGITIRPLRQMTGDEGFSEVFFDDVVVPETELLGEPGKGWTYALHTLSSERSIYVIRCRIEYETAFAEFLRQVDEEGSGSKVAALAAEELGETAVALRALRAQTEATAERVVEVHGPSPEDSLDKLLLANVDQTMFSNFQRLLGAARSVQSGSTFGIPRGRLVHGYLYSRAGSIYGGTSQVQRNIVAQRLLGLPRTF